MGLISPAEKARHDKLLHLGRVLRPYGGAIHADSAAGIVDVEFGSLARAVEFMNDNALMPFAVPRDPITQFTGTVVITFPLDAFK